MSADRSGDYPTMAEALALRVAADDPDGAFDNQHGPRPYNRHRTWSSVINRMVAAGWAVADTYRIDGPDSWPIRRHLITDDGRAALDRYRQRLHRQGWADTGRLTRAAAALAYSLDQTPPDALRERDTATVDAAALADVIEALRELGTPGWWNT